MSENHYSVNVSEKELQAIFELFDFNKIGLIRVNDFQKIMESQGFYPTKSEIRKMLNNAVYKNNNTPQDSPKDDLDIDFKAFVKIANSEINKNVKKSEAKAAFSVLDKDDDGLISREDLKKSLQAYLHSPTELEIDQLMKEAGVDVDDDIDFHHFTLAFGLDA